MPEEIKLKLETLKVQSFVTHLNHMEKCRMKGGFGVPGSKDIHKCASGDEASDCTCITNCATCGCNQTEGCGTQTCPG